MILFDILAVGNFAIQMAQSEDPLRETFAISRSDHFRLITWNPCEALDTTHNVQPTFKPKIILAEPHYPEAVGTAIYRFLKQNRHYVDRGALLTIDTFDTPPGTVRVYLCNRPDEKGVG